MMVKIGSEWTGRLVKASVFGCSALLLASCGAGGPLANDFGESVRMAQASQRLNPPPADPEAPVTGIDGVAVANTRDAYQKSFEVKDDTRPTAVFSFGKE